MSFSYEDRLADSPFVQTIWHTQSEGNGCYLSPADGSWDVLVVKHNSETKLFVAGPGTKATPIFYKDGMEYLGIRFKVGAFMPQLPPITLVDSMTMLPKATHHSFWLGDVAWQVPNFEDVEVFVEGLERRGLLARDGLVEAVLEDEKQSLSHRSVQRHFLQTTGLTQNCIRQIERARNAAALLQQDVSIADTIYRVGYTDQPHMTKALKRFIGRTPAQLVHLSQFTTNA
jgi:Helix-turn-helix domain